MAAAAAALALVLAACGSADSDDSAAPVTSAPVADDTGDDAPASTPPSDSTAPAAPLTTDDATAPTPTDAVVVPDILQFSAPLVGGGTFDGAAVAGMPTAFWFWAPT